MKTTIRKTSLTFIAITGIAILISISSCEKNDSSGPADQGAVLTRDVLLEKTNGGKQAIVSTHHDVERQANINSLVFKSNANMYGSSYSVWSSKWWKWGMELPPVSNHPFNDSPGFDVTMGQTGSVWFLAGVFGNVSRTCTIPSGKSLFVGLINGEASDLEGLGNTYSERLSTANWQADHIVPSSLSCTIDGQSVDLSSFRIVTPDFSFTAPTPWIFGPVGGHGKSVGDGYFIMLKELSAGTHTLHYTGAYHFTVAEDGFDFDASMDMTYHLIQL